MLNIYRLKELVFFDLYHSLSSMRSAIFIIPYFLFWFLIFYNISEESVNWIKGVGGLAATSWLLGNQELAISLIAERSAVLSFYLIVSVVIMPMFVMFVANNPFSSNFATGTFRFLSMRSTRKEIYLSRILSAFIVVSLCLILTTFCAAIVAMINDDNDIDIIMSYALQISIILTIYSLPFITYVGLISIITRSAIGNLFLSMTIYTILVFFILGFYKDYNFIVYILPSGTRPFIFDLTISNFFITIGLSCAYSLFYAALTCWCFERQDI